MTPEFSGVRLYVFECGVINVSGRAVERYNPTAFAATLSPVAKTLSFMWEEGNERVNPTF